MATSFSGVTIGLSIEEYRKVAGQSSKKIHEMLKEMRHPTIPEEVIHRRRIKCQELQAQGVPPINETIEFVRYLSQNKERSLASSWD